MCYGKSARLIERYMSIGYADADIRTFYGHGYFLRPSLLRVWRGARLLVVFGALTLKDELDDPQLDGLRLKSALTYGS